MKYCSLCGTSVPDEAGYCPKCGAPMKENHNFATTESNDNFEKDIVQIISILALVFGILGGGGGLGLVLGIVGLVMDKQGKYKKFNVIGIVLSIVWIVFAIAIFVLVFVLGSAQMLGVQPNPYPFP